MSTFFTINASKFQNHLTISNEPVILKLKEKSEFEKDIRVQWKDKSKRESTYCQWYFVGHFHSMFIGQIFCYLRVAALFTHAFLFMEKSTRILMYGCDYGCLGVCVCLCVLKVVAPLFCGEWDANV